MSRSRSQEVALLLKRGLNHYGLGEIDSAITCWENVVELDPSNSAARDYLATAYEERGDEDATPTSQPSPPDPLGDDDATPRSFGSLEVFDSGDDENLDTQIEGALEAYRGGDLDTAWNQLQDAAAKEPDRIDVQGYIGLVRSKRAKLFAEEIGDTSRCLARKRGMEELTDLNLTPQEGFLLSQIDGLVTIEEVISLSTSGRVETLEMLVRLIREGVVE